MLESKDKLMLVANAEAKRSLEKSMNPNFTLAKR